MPLLPLPLESVAEVPVASPRRQYPIRASARIVPLYGYTVPVGVTRFEAAESRPEPLALAALTVKE